MRHVKGQFGKGYCQQHCATDVGEGKVQGIHPATQEAILHSSNTGERVKYKQVNKVICPMAAFLILSLCLPPPHPRLE